MSTPDALRTEQKLSTKDILHILRNPYGKTEDEKRCARLEGADEIEYLQRMLMERPLPEWQPIETAPKGGKWVLLWWPYVTDAPFSGYETGGKWFAAPTGDSWTGSPGPTHWAPLPTGPAT